MRGNAGGSMSEDQTPFIWQPEYPDRSSMTWQERRREAYQIVDNMRRGIQWEDRPAFGPGSPTDALFKKMGW